MDGDDVAVPRAGEMLTAHNHCTGCREEHCSSIIIVDCATRTCIPVSHRHLRAPGVLPRRL
ncbi:uncharacterized protein B0H18DRAFT_992496, partial [Fomitopsis serialis]|uniref:uncharacterized protein n=1 Tax=Fomitopsis serialis TaxID=139415 RepID=UPI00200746EC